MANKSDRPKVNTIRPKGSKKKRVIPGIPDEITGMAVLIVLFSSGCYGLRACQNWLVKAGEDSQDYYNCLTVARRDGIPLGERAVLCEPLKP